MGVLLVKSEVKSRLAVKSILEGYETVDLMSELGEHLGKAFLIAVVTGAEVV